MMLAGNAVAADKWMPVMQAEGVKIELEAGSVGHEKTVTFGTFRFTTGEGQITGIAELSDVACRKGAGPISLFATNQTPTQIPYTKDARNAGGHIGTVLCSSYNYMKKQGLI